MLFPMPVQMGFVVDKVVLRQLFLPVLRTQTYPVCIIPPLLYKDIFIRLLQIFLATDSLVKYTLNKHCIQVVELGTI